MMAGKKAFRPTGLEGRERLEARLVLSHAAITHLVVPFVHGHGGGHHHVVIHKVTKGHHGKVVVGGSGAHTGNGPTSQSNPTTPIVVVPVKNTPVPSSPTSPTATSPARTSTTTTPSIAVPTVSGVMSSQEQTIVDLLNQQRAQAGLAPLQVDSRLVQAAQIHSRDMAQLGQMEHTLPGAALPTLVSRAQYVGYNYSYLGENIAFNYPDDNSVMTAWMNSPGHRANILDAHYTQVGVGISYDSIGEPYYTQEFGSPS